MLTPATTPTALSNEHTVFDLDPAYLPSMDCERWVRPEIVVVNVLRQDISMLSFLREEFVSYRQTQQPIQTINFPFAH